VQSGPILPADAYDGESRSFLCLNQRQSFEKFIQRSEPARKTDQGARVFDEHHFPGEEIVEIERYVLIRIGFLLHGEVDIESDAESFGFIGATVGGLHDSRSAAGNNGEFSFDQFAGQLSSFCVVRIVDAGSGRAEDTDGPTDLIHRFKRFDEFRHDTEDSPEVFVVKPLVGHLNVIDLIQISVTVSKKVFHTIVYRQNGAVFLRFSMVNSV